MTNLYGPGAAPRRHGALRRSLLLPTLLLLPLAACDVEGILEIDDPDVTRPEALADPNNLPAVRASAIADFAVAFGGASTTEGLVIISGIMADEFFHSGTFQHNREMDKRQVSVDNPGMSTVFRNLHRARRIAEAAADAFQVNQPSSAARAEMVSLNAYTILFFAENFCSGVPFSGQAPDGRFQYGAPQSREQMLNAALARFDEALTIATAARTGATGAAATAAERQQNLARVGRGRTLMQLNRYADAATAVAGIPTGFAYEVLFSENTTRQNNGIFGLTQSRREYGIAHRDGSTGLPFRAEPADPRVPWTRDAAAADATIRQFTPRKFDSRAIPIVLASGIEARLIEAEAGFNRGAGTAHLATLNELRATRGLAALTDPGIPAGRVDQLFAERAFWFFGTGQRMPDMRRLIRQYGRAPNTVFPSGSYVREGMDGTPRPDATGYGADVNFPVPFDEQNNPEFTACTDRNA
jgi:starch-binding outer membrane protein, SusD/RagB family